MNRIRGQVAIILISGFLSNSSVYAAIINANSCSQSDVQAAINSGSTGDTVIIPSGSCTWSTAVSIPDNKRITLQGEGYDNTIITAGLSKVLNLNQSNSRVTGIQFVIFGSYTDIIYVQGTGWRIDHCKFNNTSGVQITAIAPNGSNTNLHPTGLIDNCVFLNSRIYVTGRGNFTTESADWAQSLNLGSADTVYVEDNIFSRDISGTNNSIDCNYAGHYVFRYNTLSQTHIEVHSLQLDTSRGSRKWEIYGNSITATSYYYRAFFIRAGTGVVFNNKVHGDYDAKAIHLDNVRSHTTVGVSGKCDGSSLWDENVDGTGWPCRDQIGRSTDQWAWTNGNPYPPQASAPAYFWNNLYGESTNVPVVVVNTPSENHIKANRDYYDYNASFDGTSGVGRGALSLRPTTCTAGVAYWATDTNTLYRCSATNIWKVHYTPYIYPHPLRQASGDASPSAPRGLKIVN